MHLYAHTHVQSYKFIEHANMHISTRTRVQSYTRDAATANADANPKQTMMLNDDANTVATKRHDTRNHAIMQSCNHAIMPSYT